MRSARYLVAPLLLAGGVVRAQETLPIASSAPTFTSGRRTVSVQPSEQTSQCAAARDDGLNADLCPGVCAVERLLAQLL
jgi:hypothetical protein